ncbi:MAG: rRNA pseudouridine synthase [Rickettsiales bacterium]|jgi:23S rRNA pseudouridine2605 synthase|nr:rRNA pseudouridine synthase [Rickettsiales bacterium]
MEKEENKGERIAKVIARTGYCSRRDAEKLIADGCVKINGKIIDTPAINITDQSIKINNKLLKTKEKTRLWIFHKPKGTAVSHNAKEERCPIIFDLLPKSMPRVISVGRLDLNTEGLILLTNNGELADYLGHPSNAFERVYRARVFGRLNKKRFEAIGQYGVKIGDFKYKPMKIEIEKEGTNSWLKVSVNEGKNREVKRIMEELGLKVGRLIRIKYGPYQLEKLPIGYVKEVSVKLLEKFGWTERKD